MINNDFEAYSLIYENLNNKKIGKIEKDILKLTLSLFELYSFVDNQTYPRPSHPKKEKQTDAYFTLIAIILSLRTTLENEIKAVELFRKKYSSILDVISSSKEELQNTISCAGMPLKKANTILKISKYIMDNYSGNINNINVGNIDEIREKLLKIPGVGEKSADCMLELAFDLPSIVVDTNVFRVISRIYFSEKILSFNNKKDILIIKNFLENNLEKDYKLYQIVHTMILLHGKYLCKSIPKCINCNFRNKCNFYHKKKFEQLVFFEKEE